MKIQKIDLELIKKLRVQRDYSLQEMAEKLGFKNASTYFKYESGEYSIKADMLPKIADVLDCKIENFFN